MSSTIYWDTPYAESPSWTGPCTDASSAANATDDGVWTRYDHGFIATSSYRPSWTIRPEDIKEALERIGYAVSARIDEDAIDKVPMSFMHDKIDSCSSGCEADRATDEMEDIDEAEWSQLVIT